MSPQQATGVVAAALLALGYWLRRVMKKSSYAEKVVVTCPVCGRLNGQRKKALVALAQQTTRDIQRWRRECHEWSWFDDAQRPGCGADLAPVFLESRFFRDALGALMQLQHHKTRIATFLEELEAENKR